MFFCTNCCVIHGYTILEYDIKFNEYNENIYNLLKCKNTIYKQKKYLNKKYNLDNRIVLFLDESFENIRKHLKLRCFPICKYLNTIYQYYCDKGDIEYKPLTKSKIIKLNYNIIQILDKVYLKYPHIKIEEPLYDFDVDYLYKILLRIGIDLKRLLKKPSP